MKYITFMSNSMIGRYAIDSLLLGGYFKRNRVLQKKSPRVSITASKVPLIQKIDPINGVSIVNLNLLSFNAKSAYHSIEYCRSARIWEKFRQGTNREQYRTGVHMVILFTTFLFTALTFGLHKLRVPLLTLPSSSVFISGTFVFLALLLLFCSLKLQTEYLRLLFGILRKFLGYVYNAFSIFFLQKDK